MPKAAQLTPKRTRSSQIWPKVLKPDFEATHFTWEEALEIAQKVKQDMDAEKKQLRASKRK